MPKSTLLVTGLLIAALAALIGAALLRGSPQTPAAPQPAAAPAEPDSGLARTMTFTEPKK